jgi:hypothetical protein
VASVAYLIWEQAVTELPRCPDGTKVAAFLEDWANRAYTDTYRSGPAGRGRNTLDCPARLRCSISSAEGATLSSIRG